MAGPVITKIIDWFTPKKVEPDPAPAPLPEPAPAPTPPEPEIPAIRPSNLQFVNYIRALMILQRIPITKLKKELAKLPWLDIAYVCGIFIWVVMSCLFVLQLWRTFLS